MNRKLKWLTRVLLVPPAIAAFIWMVMALWNWLMPSLFAGIHTIDYVHTIGLLVLSRILFGGFCGRGGRHRRWHQQRWEKMTPEEREQFQQGMHRMR